MKFFFIGLFLILLSFFLFEYKLVGQAVYGDGRYYWAFTRSMYFSRNIDISDEMAHFYSPESNNKASSFSPNSDYATWTKKITHSFSLGVSLIWLPFYLLADAIVVFLSQIGFSTIRNGYSDIYQIVVGIGNILFVTSGVFILFRLLKGYFQDKVVIPSIILLIFATNLLYYAGIDVINSHPFSFFLVSVLLWSFLQYQKKRKNIFLLLLGVIVGLLAGNRTQDALYILFALTPIISFQGKKERIRELLKKSAYFLLGFLGGYLPQFLLLWSGQGRVVLIPHTEQGFSLPAHFLGIFFDPKLGIFFYMPIFLIGTLGLFLFYKQQKTLAAVFLFIILLHFLLISSWDGWLQASYSMRYLVSSLPLVAFGLAEVIKRLQKKYSSAFVYTLVTIFVMHQLLMIVSFKLFLQDPTNVGTELSRSGKMKALIIDKLDQATRNLPFR